MSATRDTNAAATLRELRRGRGLSPEEVPHAMRMAGIESRNIPSGRTIRRVEDVGVIPQVRYQFGLATFYSRSMTTIWTPRSRAPRQRVAA